MDVEYDEGRTMDWTIGMEVQTEKHYHQMAGAQQAHVHGYP